MIDGKGKTKAGIGARAATIAIILLCTAADRLSKYLCLAAFEKKGESFTVIPGLLDFTHVENPGATGGMLAEHRWVFMVVSAVVIVAVILYIILGKVGDILGSVSLAMIVGGGIGNMIDRVFRGTVIDFLDVTCFDFFPFNTVFNIADSFVCIGCMLLILSVIIDEIKERKDAKESRDTEQR